MCQEKENFDLLIMNMNAWFVARGITTPEVTWMHVYFVLGMDIVIQS